MSNLKFHDSHNMVAFLSKPTKSEGFEQIVDFLNAHPIRYALTVNPTIYVSCIEQFWSSTVAKTINGEVQLHALVDGKRVVITKTYVRRTLRLKDVEGIDCLSNYTILENLALMGPKTTAWNEFSSTMASTIICLATNQKFNFSKLIFDSMVINLDNLSDKAVYKERGGSLVRAATTASSLEAEQDSGNITKTRSKATLNEPSSPGTSSELMELCTNLQQRVLDLETTKTTQANEIASLKRRVKKLEKNDRSRTHKLKKLYKVGLSARVESSEDEEDLGEDASKQGRIADTDDDAGITLEVFVVEKSENIVKEVVDAAQTITTEEITLAKALADLKSTKPKAKGIVFREPGESITTTTTPIPSKIQDKGKGKKVEPEPVKKLSKNDQLKLDEEIALKLQEEPTFGC
ncbi:hypothetical protein Tco_1284657 [Tanacetum coccineum]